VRLRLQLFHRLDTNSSSLFRRSGMSNQVVPFSGPAGFDWRTAGGGSERRAGRGKPGTETKPNSFNSVLSVPSGMVGMRGRKGFGLKMAWKKATMLSHHPLKVGSLSGSGAIGVKVIFLCERRGGNRFRGYGRREGKAEKK